MRKSFIVALGILLVMGGFVYGQGRGYGRGPWWQNNQEWQRPGCGYGWGYGQWWNDLSKGCGWGHGPYFVDENKNGICDRRESTPKK